MAWTSKLGALCKRSLAGVDEDTVEYVVSLLSDEDTDVGSMGAPEVIALVAPLIEDDDEAVQRLARGVVALIASASSSGDTTASSASAPKQASALPRPDPFRTQAPPLSPPLPPPPLSQAMPRLPQAVTLGGDDVGGSVPDAGRAGGSAGVGATTGARRDKAQDTDKAENKVLSKAERRRARQSQRRGGREKAGATEGRSQRASGSGSTPGGGGGDAQGIAAASAAELDGLDDHASAWAQCQAEGRAWGGRGEGGRGLRSTFHSSTAVRNIHLPNVSLSFGGEDLLQSTTLQITPGKRYGLIGRNGVGKSTLLRRLARKAIPGFPMHLRVLLVNQQVDGSGESALAVLLGADTARASLLEEQSALESELDRAAGVGDGDGGGGDDGDGVDDVQVLAERLAELSEQLDAVSADSAEKRARAILQGLQFTPQMMDEPSQNLSGGWRMRLALAQALFVPSDLLLLDEPTNHLDLHAVSWLTDYLAESEHTVVVVSHDRGFLDMCTDIIQFQHKQLKYHAGGYSTFEVAMNERAARAAQMLDASERQRAKAEVFVAKQQASSSKMKKRADPKKQRQAKMVREKKIDRIGRFREDGKRYKEQSIKKLDMKYWRGSQKVSVEVDEPTLKFKFPSPAWTPGMDATATLLRAEAVSFGYCPAGAGAAAPRAPPALLSGVTLGISARTKVAVVGRNGAGKSTLLRLLTGELGLGTSSSSPSRGANRGSVWRHRDLRVAHVTQHHVEALDEHAHVTVAEYAESRLRDSAQRAVSALAATTTSLRSHLGAFGLGGSDHANRLVGQLSGGERMRLCFASMLAECPHLLVLDEPTNHLDMETLDALSSALAAFGGAVVIVSHNQRFLCGFCNELWVVDSGKVRVQHSDTNSFEDNFARYRNGTLDAAAARGNARQVKAAMSRRAAKQRSGAQQRGGFI